MITPSRAATLALLLAAIAGCASPTATAPSAATSGAAASPRGAAHAHPSMEERQITEMMQSINAAPPPPIRSGPRKRIAVIRFENAGRLGQRYGEWDVGGGLAAQLTTALIESGKFIVVERAAIRDVLREQEMELETVVSRETAAKAGHILGAQLLVKGAVTEFEQDAGGAGKVVNAQVGLDLRLIDTTTGQVVRSVRSEAKASKRGAAATIDARQVSFGSDTFNSLPLGQATRLAIQRGVAAVHAQMERLPWTARVVDVVDGVVYINAGGEAALQTGDQFVVTSIVRELTDPDTGQIRAVIESHVGQLAVEKVEHTYSSGRMVSGNAPKRGDLVKHVQ